MTRFTAFLAGCLIGAAAMAAWGAFVIPEPVTRRAVYERALPGDGPADRIPKQELPTRPTDE